MKALRFLLPFFALLLATNSLATSNLSGFMTSRDVIRNDPNSNINLQNNKSSAITVYGLYVRAYSYVTPGSSCNSATSLFSGNVTAGAYVMPTPINPGKRAAVGSNYLYNMLLQAIYYADTNIIPIPCSLPGCTWGSDSAKYNWCVQLGALAPVVTTTGYTANIPPSADAASSGGAYDYNLISSYITLGPISCSDQTLSCSAASQQIQSLS